jgi:hypothetical protein
MSIIHPIIRHLTRVEQVWAMIPEQAGLRAHMIARALVEAGYLPDAEIAGDLVIVKGSREKGLANVP